MQGIEEAGAFEEGVARVRATGEDREEAGALYARLTPEERLVLPPGQDQQ